MNNAWSDPVNSRFVTPGAISRYGGYATSARRNDPVYSTRPGNHLYAGARGDAANRFYDGRTQHVPTDRNGYRNHHRYYFNNFPYAVYYPYLYNNYGYAGYGNYGYGDGLAGYSGLNTDASVADLGAPDFSNNPNNYYSYVAPEQDAPNTDAPAASTSPLPDAPAVGPQSPSATDKSAGINLGPDSLVEAVQNELSHRGYFDGKPDSMYTPATKEAIRRFQTDQNLPATGRINEATLHALHLD